MTGWLFMAARAALLLLLAGASGCRCEARAPGSAPGQAPGDRGPGARGDTGAAASRPAPTSRPAGAETPGARDSARERIVLGGVAVHTLDPEQPREIYPRQLAQRLGLQLTESGLFAASAAEVPAGLRARPATLELRIRYDVLDQGSTGEPAVLAAVESRVVWDAPPRDAAPAEHVLAERPLDEGEEGGEVDGLVAVHVAATVEQVGRGLIAKERLRTADDAALAAVLGDAGATEDMVAWALTLATERRSAALFEAVAGRLGAEARAVRDRAVEALVALGDQRAVDRLARQVRFDDHAFLRTVIEAVGALGGDDARAYLEFLASGHPEQDIRTRAAEGLERLRRRP